jgi:hypothetical protein
MPYVVCSAWQLVKELTEFMADLWKGEVQHETSLTCIYSDKEVKTSIIIMAVLFYCRLHVSAFVGKLHQLL